MGQTLWEKHQYAKCFGHWMMSDPECIRCAVSDNCEKRTKTHVEEHQDVSEKALQAKEKKYKEVKPLDYLLERLKGKFEYSFEDKDGVLLHKYWKDEAQTNLVILVAIGKRGRIKVVSIPKDKQRLCGSISDIEDAENILKEML